MCCERAQRRGGARAGVAVRWAGPEGTVRPVVVAPEPVLSRPAGKVDPADPGTVGLAAPQIGVGVQVFVVDVTGHPKTRTCHGPMVLCNAEVVEVSRWQKGREGCMSVPDLTGDVKRAGQLVVTGQLPGGGETVTVATDAFEARALQHEIDHCAGLLFLDRVPGPHAIF